MKRAAIYARVSTHNAQNPEMQLDELRAYCGRRRMYAYAEQVAANIPIADAHWLGQQLSRLTP